MSQRTASRNQLLHQPWSFLLILGVAIGMMGCQPKNRRGLPSDPSGPAPIDVAKAKGFHERELEQEKHIAAQQAILIHGNDIQLPLTAGSFEAQEERFYTFYVWAHHPYLSELRSVAEMISNGDLRIDVLGTKAKIDIVDYGELTGPGLDEIKGFATEKTNVTSRDVIRLTVNSRDISSSFTIMVWFPRYHALSDLQLTEDMTRTINNIDRLQSELNRKLTRLSQLKTAQRMTATGKVHPSGTIDDTEEIQHLKKDIESLKSEQKLLSTKASFLTKETNPYFARKEIRVYNGDLRSQIYIEGSDAVVSSFGKQFEKFFYVGRLFLRNRHPDKRLLVYTTSLKADVLFYRPPSDNMRSTIENVRSVRNSGRTAKGISPPFQASPIPNEDSLATRRNALELTRDLRGHLTTDAGISYEQVRTIASIALTNTISQEPFDLIKQKVQFTLPPTDVNQSSRKEQIEAKAREEQGYEIAKYTRDELERVISMLGADYSRLTESGRGFAKQLHEFFLSHKPNIKKGTIESLVKHVQAIVGLPDKDSKDLKSLFNSLQTKINKTDPSPNQFIRINKIANNLQRSVERRVITSFTIEQLKGQQLDPNTEKAYVLESNANKKRILDQVIDAVSGRYFPTQPIREKSIQAVNTDNKPLAFSADATRQRKLSEFGYVWRDTYRPMTFQSVLNSLIATTESSKRAAAMRYLRAASQIAGAFVGAGAIFDEFARDGFAQTVAVSSAVIIPELGRLLEDNLNTFIRNLGELSLDTTIEIPPNGVVDKYIFFPRGPIFFGASEYEVGTPSWLVQIENSDVSVEAALIEKDQRISAGALSAANLVGRALNEGRQREAQESLKLASIDSLSREFALKLMINQAEALLDGTVPLDPVNPDPNRLRAERQVRLLKAQFEAAHGEDTTGTINSFLVISGVSLGNKKPEIGHIPNMSLYPGLASQTQSIHVSDDLTNLANLVIHSSSNNEAFISNRGISFTPKNGDKGKITGDFELKIVPNNNALEEAQEVTITLTLTDEDKAVTEQSFVVTLNKAKLVINDGQPIAINRATSGGFSTIPFHMITNDSVLGTVTFTMEILEPDPSKLEIRPTPASIIVDSSNGGRLSSTLWIDDSKAEGITEARVILTAKSNKGETPFWRNVIDIQLE